MEERKRERVRVTHPLLQMERNLQDAMQVIRNVMVDPRLVPGGGAFEMALAQMISERAKSVAGVQQWPYRAVGRALEVIPRTLIQNCGANTIRVLTTLRVSQCSYVILPPPHTLSLSLPLGQACVR